jgi:subtilisin family serine protease
VGLAAVQPAAAEPKPVAVDGGALTLLTGDQVVVGEQDAVRSVKSGPGRDAIVFSHYRKAGHQYVVPEDALVPIRQGRVDERIFDVTTLREFGYGDAAKPVPLIISYPPGTLRATVANTTTTADLAGVNASAVSAPKSESAWQSVLGAGASKIWLDGQVHATLDRSTKQIGAPVAWAAGYTGEGVKVAVLDTGVDQTHPDLAGQEILEKNFSASADNVDRYGHGTHVAATIASTGAKADGKFRGVAPGVRLLDGKVLGDGGAGAESGVILGMQWAVEQGARIISMSLGGTDSSSVDPVEEAVNTLSAQHGTLFVIAAGNDGPRNTTVGSPGSADAALTVGAVDRNDQLAPFSSRGPRVGDGEVKPDITAPGVDIVAARAANGRVGTPVQDGYVRMSGTSMATPHVAGAAAILAQQHPDWTGSKLKAALTASAKPTAGLTPFEQGSGRVDVPRAITQSVSTSPTSVSLGTHVYPHDDDKPVTKTVTYRNAGTTDQVLDLKLDTNGPAGMFSLTPAALTVPAGGEATATITGFTGMNTADGTYHGAVVATGADEVVRTPVVIVREAESYNLTLNHIQRPGAPSGNYSTTITYYDTDEQIQPYEPDGSVTVRLPKGRYLIDSSAGGPTFDWLVRPSLVLDKDTTVDLDFRLAQPIKITAPDPTTRVIGARVAYTHRTGTGATMGRGSSSGGDASLNRMRLAQVGPPAPADEQFRTLVSTQSVAGNGDFYGLAWYQNDAWLTGLVKSPAKEDLAHVHADLQAAGTGTGGRRLVQVLPKSGPTAGEHGLPLVVAVPGVRDEYLTTESTTWRTDTREIAADGFTTTFEQRGPVRDYEPGKTYNEHVNRGVLGPAFPAPGEWVTRNGDRLTVDAPLFGDRDGNAGTSWVDPRTTAVYRDGKKLGEQTSASAVGFEVPADTGDYRVTTEATRGGATTSSKVSAAWTFRSRHTDQQVRLPLSAVRFDPALDDAHAGRPFTIPVSVQSQTTGQRALPTGLTVQVSYDGGNTWQPTLVLARSLVVLHHPKNATSVSLKAKATDRAGNTVEQTIIDAYHLS